MSRLRRARSRSQARRRGDRFGGNRRYTLGDRGVDLTSETTATHHTPDWLVLTLVCVAQFMVLLDVSIVNVALPSIKHSLGFSQVELQWVLNAYTLTFAGFLLLGGRTADLFGRRRIFLVGLTVFTLASPLEAWHRIRRC